MNRLVVFVSGAAAVGCTAHKDLRDARDLSGERVTIDTRHGRTTAQVRSAGNEVTFIDAADGLPVASETVVRIEDKSRALGAGQGLLIGAGLGFLTGVAIHSIGDNDCDGCVDLGPVFTGMYFGAIGSLAGLVVGAIVGHTTIYESRTSGVAVQVGGPSGSTAGLTVRF